MRLNIIIVLFINGLPRYYPRLSQDHHRTTSRPSSVHRPPRYRHRTTVSSPLISQRVSVDDQRGGIRRQPEVTTDRL